MNKTAWIILAGAAIVIAAILIFRRRAAGTNTSIVNHYQKSPKGTDGIPGSDSGYNIDVSWLWQPNEPGIDNKIVTYTNE